MFSMVPYLVSLVTWSTWFFHTPTDGESLLTGGSLMSRSWSRFLFLRAFSISSLSARLRENEFMVLVVHTPSSSLRGLRISLFDRRYYPGPALTGRQFLVFLDLLCLCSQIRILNHLTEPA